MTKFYNLFFFVGVMSILGACTTPPLQNQKTKSTEGLPAHSEDLIGDFAKAKLHKNGEYLFCDQPGYLDCYKISHQQCLREVSAVKEDCFKRTEKKFPDPIASEKDIDQFAKYFAFCLAIQHAIANPGRDTKELNACMEKINFDKVQRDKSLLR